MSRVALYARYSSDRQRAASIEDQLRLCRDHAIAQGREVVDVYSDEAVSGASLHGRPGILAMLDAAREGRFEIVSAEALDRLSRDQEDVARLFKAFRFAGIQLSTITEGEVDELHVGLKGTMNALFLTDLANKTRRGLRGRIEQGRSGGGLCYGYDVWVDADGEVGGRIVNEAQAVIVRRILTEYADGTAPRSIAERLNKEGVPGVGGRPWNALSATNITPQRFHPVGHVARHTSAHPLSASAVFSHSCSVRPAQPIFAAIDTTVAHCDGCSRS